MAFGGRSTLAGATITARGMDFLPDDGGIGAILGMVAGRLHEETLLPAEATKSVVLDAAKIGLQRGARFGGLDH